MRKIIIGIALIVLSSVCFAQQIDETTSTNTLPKVALSTNVGGFLFFGPTVDLGIGVSNRTVINAHARFTPLGLVSRMVKDLDGDGEQLDKFTGTGFGGGIIQFQRQDGTGLYYGGQVEFEKMTTTYWVDEPFEWYEVGYNYVFVANAGYRIALSPSVFVNLGGFLGGIFTDFNWDYQDPSFGVDDPEPREGTTLLPVGSLEVAIGIKIK